MDAREQRAIMIAAMCRIDKQGGLWQVPSQTASDRKYQVNLDGNGTCTCPDCVERGFICKHIRAVRITIKRELGMDGSIVETKQMLFEEKKTYTQDWRSYNRAQSVEKDRVQVILHDLCSRLPSIRQKNTGRKPHSTSDSIFAMALKVYGGFSSRRFSTDLREAHQKGYLSKPIPGMKVPVLMRNEAFTPILRNLVAASAAPLRAVETQFAVDSSGFASTRFETWYDAKYGVTKRKCTWVKAHICCGTKTNCITAVRILDKDAADSPQFKPLVNATAERFTIGEV